MPANFNMQARAPSAAAIALALLLVYVVWGTTYFAIGITLTSMPPLLMNAIRFLGAGGVMLLVALWQGHALPTARQWRNAAVVGGCMVFLAMNLTGFAQKLGIGSGLMATVVTTMPMWLALWSRLGGERVPATSWIGLALGGVGALLLARAIDDPGERDAILRTMRRRLRAEFCAKRSEPGRETPVGRDAFIPSHDLLRAV